MAFEAVYGPLASGKGYSPDRFYCVPRALSSESHRPSPLSERQNEGRTAEPSGPTDARRFGFFATCLLKLRLVSCTSSIICYP